MKHQVDEIFQLAGWLPITDHAAEVAVQEVEDRIGTRLPSLFRQFLLYANGADLLRQHSNCDEPIKCSKLGSPPYKHNWGTYDPLKDKLLPFMIENQGVCTWAIKFEGADNPRVFVEVDSGCPPKWELTGETFTEWLTCQVEDKLLLESASLAAQAPGLRGKDLRWLRQNFSEGRKTFSWPGETNYRFSNARSRLLLWSNDEQCDFWISLAEGVRIDDVLDELWNIAGLIDALYGLREDYDEALKKWKQSRSIL